MNYFKEIGNELKCARKVFEAPALSKARTVILIVLIMALSVQIWPQKANAGFPVTVVNPVTIALDVSPASISRTVDATMQRVKSYVLDGLAYRIAGIMLQQITASVVNWINTGFKGSPSFLANPEGFFLDAADQVTGNFIASTGALSKLCTPFNIDIRLSIALGQVNPNQRYLCTLSTVIQNAKNATVNGMSIKGFMNGDFKQGGWPAFITLTTNPQNNINSAYLAAQSDLNVRIAAKQNSIRADLNLGHGFLSWSKCNDVTNDFNTDSGVKLGLNSAQTNKLDENGSQTISTGSSGSSIQKTVAKDGTTKYEDCQVQTPGSVIAGSINKSLGIPQDRLNLANSINQIVDALFAQLVTQVLTGGLHAASNPGSGNLGGIATQLSQQLPYDQLSTSRQQLTDAINSYYTPTSQYAQLRKQAMDAIEGARGAYASAKLCFNNKISNSGTYARLTPLQIDYARAQASAIDSAIANKIVPLENIYRLKLDDANSRLSVIQSLLSQVDNAVSTEAIQAASQRFSALMQGGAASLGAASSTPGVTTQFDVLNARDDLTSVQDQIRPIAADANKYQQACDVFPLTMDMGSYYYGN